MTIYNHQPDSPLYEWPDVCSGDLQAQEKARSYMNLNVLTILRLGVIKQHKTQTCFCPEDFPRQLDKTWENREACDISGNYYTADVSMDSKSHERAACICSCDYTFFCKAVHNCRRYQQWLVQWRS